MADTDTNQIMPSHPAFHHTMQAACVYRSRVQLFQLHRIWQQLSQHAGQPDCLSWPRLPYASPPYTTTLPRPLQTHLTYEHESDHSTWTLVGSKGGCALPPRCHVHALLWTLPLRPPQFRGQKGFGSDVTAPGNRAHNPFTPSKWVNRKETIIKTKEGKMNARSAVVSWSCGPLSKQCTCLLTQHVTTDVADCYARVPFWMTALTASNYTLNYMHYAVNSDMCGLVPSGQNAVHTRLV